MNNNETSILPHTVTLPLVQRADEFVENYMVSDGVLLSSAGILLACVETITDNRDYPLEVRITKDGYQIAFPQTMTVEDVLEDFNQAFEALGDD